MVSKRKEKMRKMAEKSIENQKKKMLDFIPAEVKASTTFAFRCLCIRTSCVFIFVHVLLQESDKVSKESDTVQALASSLKNKGMVFSFKILGRVSVLIC